MIVELKPTSLIATEVPIDADDFEFHYRNYEPYVTYKTGMGTEDFDILRMSIPKGRYEILGEVTKDKIGFDVEPYVNCISANLGLWENYNKVPNYLEYQTKSKEESFYSLLAANRLYFENPVDKISSKEFISLSIDEFNSEWQSFEEKLIHGKLLILEKF